MNLTHTNKIGSLVEETTFFSFFLNMWMFSSQSYKCIPSLNACMLLLSRFYLQCFDNLSSPVQLPNSVQLLSDHSWMMSKTQVDQEKSSTRLRHSRQPHFLHHTFRGQSWSSPLTCIFHCNSSQMMQRIHFLPVPSTHNLQIFNVLKTMQQSKNDALR